MTNLNNVKYLRTPENTPMQVAWLYPDEDGNEVLWVTTTAEGYTSFEHALECVLKLEELNPELVDKSLPTDFTIAELREEAKTTPAVAEELEKGDRMFAVYRETKALGMKLPNFERHVKQVYGNANYAKLLAKACGC